MRRTVGRRVWPEGSSLFAGDFEVPSRGHTGSRRDTSWLSTPSSPRRLALGLPPQWLDLEMPRSEEHTSELQSRLHLVCRLLLEKKKKNIKKNIGHNV